MPSAILKSIPDKGTDLEHYVAALFQAAGYYVEKNLVERVPTDVLELDIVATNYSEYQPSSILAEVKGGGWGWSDLFKILGWMRYLDPSKSVLFASDSNKKPITAMIERLGSHGISVVCFQSYETPYSDFSEAGYGQPHDELVALWRHSYAIEQKLSQVVAEAAKAGIAGGKAALDYQGLVNNGVFFARNTIERLSMLYDAYKAHPKLTAAMAAEMDGKPFDPQTTAANTVYLKEALYDGKHPLLQACMFLEHRARLTILKAAVDFAIENPNGPPLLSAGPVDWLALLWAMLPETFKDGYEWLVQQTTFRRYPLLWQQFLWGYGGFILDNKKDEEYQWLSTYSGVPLGEVATALKAFDQLFPLVDGWFVESAYTDVRLVKMVPSYFQGLGAHHRRQQYSLQNFGTIGQAQYTGRDLAKWNNSAVYFLTD